MAHFKGHKLKAEEGVISFDGAVDAKDLKRELENLRGRRKALVAKRDALNGIIQGFALEEAELTDILREVGEEV